MKKRKKIFRNLLKWTLGVLAILTISIFIYMKKPKFGKIPDGDRLALVEKSPNYKNNKFNNRTPRPTITPGFSMSKVAMDFFFAKDDRSTPTIALPSVKTNLKTLPIDSNLVIWFGHSSMYMQFDGKKYLIDPVFSGSASPVPGSVKAFKGTDVYTVDDMPEVDYLLISHDHYDHLDYKTIVALQPKVNKVICGLGVGSHFEYWGYQPDQLIEKDWYDSFDIDELTKLHILPTHHSSGRSLKQSKTLWVSFLLEGKYQKIFYSGDGGYDAIYKEIGEKFGPIDFVMMECGQYNPAWQSVHKLPEEVKLSTIELKAKRMMPVHHSKFKLARHPWDEPLKLMTEYAKDAPYTLAAPKIGEVVYLNQPQQKFDAWWVGIE